MVSRSVLLPFAACGPLDARQHAISVTGYLAEAVPGFVRELTQVFDSENPNAPLPVWCPEPGCIAVPYHPGPHEIPETAESDKAEQ